VNPKPNSNLRPVCRLQGKGWTHVEGHVQILRVEWLFTYSCGAAIGVQIAYSAWFILYTP